MKKEENEMGVTIRVEERTRRGATTAKGKEGKRRGRKVKAGRMCRG